MGSSNVSSTVDIAAPAESVYALITDLDVLTELADETATMRLSKGSAVAPGAVFRGTNRNGWHRWTTTCQVTDADAGRRFAFDVTYIRVPVARWQYDIEPTDSGCRVTETMWDKRPAWFSRLSYVGTGVSDRGAANAEHIEATLTRLKARAEAS